MLSPQPGTGVAGASEVGRVRFIASNGGPHSPETWAQLTVEDVLAMIEIVPTGSAATIQAMAAKQDLRPKLLALLAGHYRLTQNGERSAIVKKTVDDRLDPAVGGVCNDLYRLLATTPFADHFARDDVQAHLHRVLGQHTANVIHIERRYFAEQQGA